MGNDISVDTERVIHDYSYVRSLNDPLFGRCFLLKHKNKALGYYVMKELTFKSKPFFKENLELWQLRLKLRHQNIIQLEEVNSQEIEALVATSYKINLFFVQINATLQQEIDLYNKRLGPHRKAEDDLLVSQEEAWFLLESLVKALSYLQKNGLYHGDLQLKHIFMTRQKKYKIADHTLFNHLPSYLRLVSMDKLPPKTTRGIYLSPEQMRCLSMKVQEITYDVHRTDIFALAMCLLHLFTNQPQDECYDFKVCAVDFQKVQEGVERVGQLYGQQMQLMLSEMLAEKDYERPDFSEILECIDEHKDDQLKEYIKNREQSGINQSRIKHNQRMNKTMKNSRLMQQSRIHKEAQESSDLHLKQSSPKGSPMQLGSQFEFSQMSSIYKLKRVSETYPDGSRYEGEKKEERKHGKGKYWLSDGTQYDGEWRADKMEGRGNMYDSNARLVYQGDWLQDQFHGFGILFNFDATSKAKADYYDFGKTPDLWNKYEGDFQQDRKHGYGILYFPSSEKFSGRFHNDTIHGKGTFYLSDGTVINGTWQHGRLV